MAVFDVSDKKLIEDVEKLRLQFPQTKELYREVCSLMFFRYGIQPTANKLYQLVRKGTMSTPAQAVSSFWLELRDKSRVAIEHPGLPENIREVAGNAFSTLWNAALEAANQNLGSIKMEMDQLIARHEKETADYAIKLNLASETEKQLSLVIENLKNDLQEANKKILINTLISTDQNKSILELEKDKQKLDEELKALKNEYTNEISKMHDSMKLSDERYRKLEAKTLLDVDRERQRCLSIESELKQTQKASAKELSLFNTQTAKTQKLINQLRENIGELKGQLKVFTRKSVSGKHKDQAVN